MENNYLSKSQKELEELEGDLVARIVGRTDAAEANEKALGDDELAADKADNDELLVIRSAIATKVAAAKNKALVGHTTRSTVSIPAAVYATPKSELTLNDEICIMRGWMQNQVESARHHVTDRVRNLAERAGCDLSKNEFVLRSQTVGTANTGGNGVNGALVVGFEKATKTYSNFIEEMRKLDVGHGGPTKWLFNDNTGNRATYVAELGSLSGTTRNVTKVDFPSAPKLGSGVFDITEELQNDANFPVLQFANDTILDSLARGRNYQATVGDNDTGHWQGILPYATAVEAADDVTITFADWKKLKFSMDFSLRSVDETFVMCHDAIVGELEKLVDENKRPLWQPDYINGTVGKLDGFRVVINNDLPSTIEASAKVLMLVNRNKFVIREVGGPRIVSQYNHKTDSMDFAGYLRGDSRGINPAGVKVLQMKAS